MPDSTSTGTKSEMPDKRNPGNINNVLKPVQSG